MSRILHIVMAMIAVVALVLVVGIVLLKTYTDPWHKKGG